jgi:hypothetical protein
MFLNRKTNFRNSITKLVLCAASVVDDEYYVSCCTCPCKGTRCFQGKRNLAPSGPVSFMLKSTNHPTVATRSWKDLRTSSTLRWCLTTDLQTKTFRDDSQFSKNLGTTLCVRALSSRESSTQSLVNTTSTCDFQRYEQFDGN